MSRPFAAIPGPRLNGLVLVLCAMALASPLVEPVPGKSAGLFWTTRAVGLSFAIAALWWPRIQRCAVGVVAVLMVAVPCVLQMHYRAWTGPETWCHDSVLQFEEAIHMVRHHRNPYREDFTQTALPRWKNWKENPAIYHFVYPPFLLYLSVPVEMVSRAVLWKMPQNVEILGPRFYDQRLVILAFFGGLFGIVWSHLRDHPHRVGLASLIVLNPWVAPFVVEGRNDVVMLFWVAAAWIAYDGGDRRYGHLLLGLGIATKTLLLPVVPFVASTHRREWPLCLALLLGPLLVTATPFLAADPRAFLSSVFGAPAGLGAHPFEIRGPGGLGFGNLVLALRWAKSAQAYFPFSIFQALAYAPCLIYGMRSLKKDPGSGNLFLWSAAGVFVVLFFGRFIHDNYIGALLSLAVMSQTVRGTSPTESSTSAAG
jgi:hypothetical protein